MEEYGNLSTEQKENLLKLALVCMETFEANRLAFFISKELVSFRPSLK